MFGIHSWGLAGRLAILSAGLVLAGFGCDFVKVTRLYERGVVASASPDASGGNAFDAAVAVGFGLAVTYPQAGNLGGGGFAVVRDGKTARIEALDFRETAPESASEDMYLDANGAPRDSLSTRGALATGVPGTVAGLYSLWERFGTLQWQDLVTRAARLADTGFVINDHLAATFERCRESLSEFEETRALFLPGGKLPQAGERMRQAELAHSLYLIAADGPGAFYSGSIADSLVTCMDKYGGLVTRHDLGQYEPHWRQPVHFTFDSLDIYSMPPPSSGGIMIGQILKLLEPYDFARFAPDSPDYIHLFCEVCRLAFADRSEHLGDPDYWSVSPGLLDPRYLQDRRELIPLHHAGRSEDVGPGRPLTYESEETTHYSICDAAGNMVAITTTLNSSFGSGLAVAGAGFLLNNEMDDFSIKPGHPNLWGLVGAEANKIEPGKRMLSSMAPTLVLKEGQPLLILGSPGGSKIITAVAQGIINFTRFGLSLEETASQPRFHHQWLPDRIYLEEGNFDVATIQRLIRYGHEIKERSPYGDLEMICIEPSGLMNGVSDPRSGGAVAGCDSPTIH